MLVVGGSSRVAKSVRFPLFPQAVFILGLAVLACAEDKKKEEKQEAAPAEKKQDKRGIFGLGYGAAPALAAPSLSYASHALASPSLSYASPALAAPSLSYAAPALAAPSVLAHSPAISYGAPAFAAPAVSYAAPTLAHAPAAVSTHSPFLFPFSILQYVQT
jgi:hypothetical protein